MKMSHPVFQKMISLSIVQARLVIVISGTILCTWSVSLFEQAQINRAGCFVYISSIAALGYKNRESNILDETSTPVYVEGEYYGKSKLLAEKKLIEISQNSSTRLLILRPGLIYGNRAFSLPQTWLRRGFMVDPRQKIPLSHITNFAQALIKLVQLTNSQGVFVVVDDEQPEIAILNELKIRHGLLAYHPWRIGKSGYLLMCLCRLLYRILKRRFDRSLTNQIIADYYFQTRRLMYSTKKLRSEADWEPAVRLEDGLALSSPNREK